MLCFPVAQDAQEGGEGLTVFVVSCDELRTFVSVQFTVVFSLQLCGFELGEDSAEQTFRLRK